MTSPEIAALLARRDAIHASTEKTRTLLAQYRAHQAVNTEHLNRAARNLAKARQALAAFDQYIAEAE